MPCRVRRHRDYQSGNIKHQTLDIRYQRHQTSDIRHQSKDRGGQGQGLELELEMEMETGTRAVMKCFFLSSSFPFFLFSCFLVLLPLPPCQPVCPVLMRRRWVGFLFVDEPPAQVM